MQSEQQFMETDPSLWDTSTLLLWPCGKRIKKTRAQIWNPPRALFWQHSLGLAVSWKITDLLATRLQWVQSKGWEDVSSELLIGMEFCIAQLLSQGQSSRWSGPTVYWIVWPFCAFKVVCYRDLGSPPKCLSNALKGTQDGSWNTLSLQTQTSKADVEPKTLTRLHVSDHQETAGVVCSTAGASIEAADLWKHHLACAILLTLNVL